MRNAISSDEKTSNNYSNIPHDMQGIGPQAVLEVEFDAGILGIYLI